MYVYTETMFPFFDLTTRLFFPRILRAKTGYYFMIFAPLHRLTLPFSVSSPPGKTTGSFLRRCASS